jgi:hypothetical protein
MKKHLLIAAFILGSSIFANAQQTISQNNDTETLENGGSVGCGNGNTNSFSRSFVLADYEITEDFTVTEVEFGLQDYFATPITIKLFTTSEAYPGGYPASLTEIASEIVTYTENGQALFVMKQVPFNAVIPAGSELVVEISGAFFIGGNTAGSTDPSYIMAPGCTLTTPTDATTLGPDFQNVNFVINVTGTTGTAGINETLAAKFSVFPNPASNVITITAAENILVTGVTIADMNGRTVKSFQFDGVANADLNISDMASGVYMMTVASDKGTMTRKIVKN